MKESMYTSWIFREDWLIDWLIVGICIAVFSVSICIAVFPVGICIAVFPRFQALYNNTNS